MTKQSNAKNINKIYKNKKEFIMNTKKILSLVLACAMMLSLVSISAYASDFIDIYCDVVELRGEDLVVDDKITLDYGLNFTAKDTAEDMETSPYAKYIVDYVISFDEDVTAILAGQYDAYAPNWLPLNDPLFSIGDLECTEKGYSFVANEEYAIMQLAGDLLEEMTGDNPVITYEQIVTSVGSFNCGVKITEDKNVDVTLKLNVYPTEVSIGTGENQRNEYEIVGEPYTVYEGKYSHEGAVEIDTTLPSEELVEVINTVKVDSYTSEDTKAAVVEAITALDKEEAVKVNAEVLSVVATEENDNYNAIPGTNTGIEIDVEESTSDHPILSQGIVFDITATNTATNEEVKELDAPVVVKIPVSSLNLDENETVDKIYHDHDGEISELNYTIKDGIIYITMIKFSNTSITTREIPQNGTATLGFAPKADAAEGTAEFYLVLTGDTSNTVRGLASGEFVLSYPDVDASFTLTANNATYLSNLGNGRYRFNLEAVENPEDAWTMQDANIVNNGIVIATLTIVGRDVDGTVAVTEIIDMEKYAPGTTTDTAAIATTPGASAIFDIEVPTRTLKITVDNSKYRIGNQIAAYQDMTIKIKGLDIATKTYKLGSDASETIISAADDIYTFEVELPVNGIYTVSLEGKGYRKAEYEISMRTDKELAFWNSYIFGGKYMETYTGSNGLPVGAGFVKSNFIAGDIVSDNIINEYDMSAVVSYFGETAETNAESWLTSYDINRDGIVDSKDIAIVFAGLGY